MTCEKCGAELRVGDYPFCGPGGHARGVAAVVADEIPGGMWVENGFPQPIKVHSHSEHRRLLAERGLEIAAKWAGPHDRHLKRWDTVDLEGAAALVSRGEQARAEKRRLAAEFPIDVTDIRYEQEAAHGTQG